MDVIYEIRGLKKGNHVIILRDNLQESNDSDSWGNEVRKSHYSGYPYEVLAVSYPFIMVNSHNGIDAIDTRECTLCHADKAYVQQFRKYVASRPMMGHQVTNHQVIQSASKIEFNTERTCPQCGGLLVDLMIAGEKIWRVKCQQCGFEPR